VKDSLNKQISYIYLNLGVIYEKLGKRKESEENYLRSLRYDPFNYQAHYNMAILYWNIDKNRVKQELTETLRINPEHKEAKYYLGK
jgi:tetratricopeptide (TPR) repeat protein